MVNLYTASRSVFIACKNDQQIKRKLELYGRLLMGNLLTGLLVFLISLATVTFTAKKIRLSVSFVLALFLWHTAFSLAYWYYFSGADASSYFNLATNGGLDFTPGGRFVNSIAMILVQGLGFSFLNSFLFFNLIGTLGLLLLAKTLLEVSGDGWERKIAIAVVFLPGLSFWSSALGKDAIAFFGISSAVYASVNIQRRWILFSVGSIFLFLVRPYAAAFQLAAAVMALTLSRRVSVVKRAAFLTISGGTAGILIPFALNYVGLGEANSLADTADYIENRQSYNLGGGSSIDIREMSMPVQLFTYMFRPLFFDARGLLDILVSAENAALFALFIATVVAVYKVVRSSRSFVVSFNFIYLTIGWIVFAVTTANLGLAVRSKTMLLPSLLVLCLIALLSKTSGMKGLPESEIEDDLGKI